MTKFKQAIRYFHEERFDYDPNQTVLKNFKAWLTPMRYEREYNGDKQITDRDWETTYSLFKFSHCLSP